MLKKLIAFSISFLMVFEQAGLAQVAPQTIIPGYLQGLLPADRFRPVHVRCFELNPRSGDLELFLDRGDAKNLTDQDIEASSRKLFDYFKIGLALPNSMFWVNLRPDSPDTVIDPLLAKTDVGKVLLAADLQLKQDLALLTSPDLPTGRKYWDQLYAKAENLFGPGEDMQVPTMSRPWIIPAEVIIAETARGAYIYKATLKVMLEEDYLKDSVQFSFDDPRLKTLNDHSAELIKQLIIPQLTREVNSSRRYAELRQVYYSLIMAQYFKAKFRTAASAQPAGIRRLVQNIDSQELGGLTSAKEWSPSTYFKSYQQSFLQGEYSKQETINTPGGLMIRSYQVGGMSLVLDGESPDQGRLTVIKSKMTAIADKVLVPLVRTIKKDMDTLVSQEQGIFGAGGGASAEPYEDDHFRSLKKEVSDELPADLGIPAAQRDVLVELIAVLRIVYQHRRFSSAEEKELIKILMKCENTEKAAQALTQLVNFGYAHILIKFSLKDLKRFAQLENPEIAVRTLQDLDQRFNQRAAQGIYLKEAEVELTWIIKEMLLRSDNLEEDIDGLAKTTENLLNFMEVLAEMKARKSVSQGALISLCKQIGRRYRLFSGSFDQLSLETMETIYKNFSSPVASGIIVEAIVGAPDIAEYAGHAAAINTIFPLGKRESEFCDNLAKAKDPIKTIKALSVFAETFEKAGMKSVFEWEDVIMVLAGEGDAADLVERLIAGDAFKFIEEQFIFHAIAEVTQNDYSLRVYGKIMAIMLSQAEPKALMKRLFLDKESSCISGWKQFSAASDKLTIALEGKAESRKYEIIEQAVSSPDPGGYFSATAQVLEQADSLSVASLLEKRAPSFDELKNLNAILQELEFQELKPQDLKNVFDIIVTNVPRRGWPWIEGFLNGKGVEKLGALTKNIAKGEEAYDLNDRIILALLDRDDAVDYIEAWIRLTDNLLSHGFTEAEIASKISFGFLHGLMENKKNQADSIALAEVLEKKLFELSGASNYTRSSSTKIINLANSRSGNSYERFKSMLELLDYWQTKGVPSATILDSLQVIFSSSHSAGQQQLSQADLGILCSEKERLTEFLAVAEDANLLEIAPQLFLEIERHPQGEQLFQAVSGKSPVYTMFYLAKEAGWDLARKERTNKEIDALADRIVHAEGVEDLKDILAAIKPQYAPSLVPHAALLSAVISTETVVRGKELRSFFIFLINGELGNIIEASKGDKNTFIRLLLSGKSLLKEKEVVKMLQAQAIAEALGISLKLAVYIRDKAQYASEILPQVSEHGAVLSSFIDQINLEVRTHASEPQMDKTDVNELFDAVIMAGVAGETEIKATRINVDGVEAAWRLFQGYFLHKDFVSFNPDDVIGLVESLKDLDAVDRLVQAVLRGESYDLSDGNDLLNLEGKLDYEKDHIRMVAANLSVIGPRVEVLAEIAQGLQQSKGTINYLGEVIRKVAQAEHIEDLINVSSDSGIALILLLRLKLDFFIDKQAQREDWIVQGLLAYDGRLSLNDRAEIRDIFKEQTLSAQRRIFLKTILERCDNNPVLVCSQLSDLHQHKAMDSSLLQFFNGMYPTLVKDGTALSKYIELTINRSQDRGKGSNLLVAALKKVVKNGQRVANALDKDSLYIADQKELFSLTDAGQSDKERWYKEQLAEELELPAPSAAQKPIPHVFALPLLRIGASDRSFQRFQRLVGALEKGETYRVTGESQQAIFAALEEFAGETSDPKSFDSILRIVASRYNEFAGKDINMSAAVEEFIFLLGGCAEAMRYSGGKMEAEFLKEVKIAAQGVLDLVEKTQDRKSYQEISGAIENLRLKGRAVKLKKLKAVLEESPLDLAGFGSQVDSLDDVLAEIYKAAAERNSIITWNDAGGKDMIDLMVIYLRGKGSAERTLFLDAFMHALRGEAAYKQWRYAQGNGWKDSADEGANILTLLNEIAADDPALLSAERISEVMNAWEQDITCKAVFNSEDGTGEATAVFTDLFTVLFNIGNGKLGSCQSPYGSDYLNRGLMGYIANAQTKALAVLDRDGRVMARRIVRFVVAKDEQGVEQPAIFMEKPYTVANSKGRQAAEALEAMVSVLAKKTGLPIIDSAYILQEDDFGSRERGVLQLRLPLFRSKTEYFDSFHGILDQSVPLLETDQKPFAVYREPKYSLAELEKKYNLIEQSRDGGDTEELEEASKEMEAAFKKYQDTEGFLGVAVLDPENKVVEKHFHMLDPALQLLGNKQGFFKETGREIFDNDEYPLESLHPEEKSRHGEYKVTVLSEEGGIVQPAADAWELGPLSVAELLEEDSKKTNEAPVETGGIDFRALPFSVQPQAVLSGTAAEMAALRQLAQQSQMKDLDAEWQDIRTQCCKGQMPYSRIKEYVAVCDNNGNCQQRIDLVYETLVQLLRVEEDCAVATDARLTELLVVLNSLETV